MSYFSKYTTQKGNKELLSQETTINFDNCRKGVIQHQMETVKGDSGAPLIVQPEGVFFCFIIGIHCSGKNDRDGFKDNSNNKAVMITKQVVEKLALFEKKLNQTEVSLIQELSFEFDKMKDRTHT